MNIFQVILAALTGRSITVSLAVNPLIVEDAAPTRLNDEQAKTCLVKMLDNQKYRFRSIDKMSKVIGRDQFETEKLLADIDARPSRRNTNLFGLVSRVGSRQYA